MSSRRPELLTYFLGALTLLRPVSDAMKERGGGAVVLFGSQSMFKPALPRAGYDVAVASGLMTRKLAGTGRNGDTSPPQPLSQELTIPATGCSLAVMAGSTQFVASIS